MKKTIVTLLTIFVLVGNYRNNVYAAYNYTVNMSATDTDNTYNTIGVVWDSTKLTIHMPFWKVPWARTTVNTKGKAEATYNSNYTGYSRKFETLTICTKMTGSKSSFQANTNSIGVTYSGEEDSRAYFTCDTPYFSYDITSSICSFSYYYQYAIAEYKLMSGSTKCATVRIETELAW